MLYEGQFVNGEFHGIGKLSYKDGSYLYGNFRNGEPKGRVLSYNNESDSWYMLDDINYYNYIDGQGFPPIKYDGQINIIGECLQYHRKFNDINFLQKFEIPKKYLFEKFQQKNNWQRLG